MTATPAESAGSHRRGVGGNGTHPRRPGRAWRSGQAITGREVRAALAALDTGYRQVIIEIYYRGRSLDETADLLCVSADTVAARAYAATCQLQLAVRAIRELPRVSGASDHTSAGSD
jgi:DNA-directed RNA polymerase specialized sigma24 family protein